jgi:signal transduction histidine kinase
MHRFKAETKHLYLKLNATDNIPELALVDNARFTQVLVNLISNAVKFTEEGGVTVNAYFNELEPGVNTESIQHHTEKFTSERRGTFNDEGDKLQPVQSQGTLNQIEIFTKKEGS